MCSVLGDVYKCFFLQAKAAFEVWYSNVGSEVGIRDRKKGTTMKKKQ